MMFVSMEFWEMLSRDGDSGTGVAGVKATVAVSGVTENRTQRFK